jgi:hypothetical protein
MKTLTAISLGLLCCIGIAKAQSSVSDTARKIPPGLDIPPAILNLPLSDPNRQGYIDIQTARTRNRTLLDLALNYSPLSYVTGEFLDPFHPKKKNYILDADVSPQFAIGGEWMPFPILITPRYLVRILGDDPAAGDYSEPVRTPSFMPGITIFVPFQKVMTDQTKKVYFGSVAVFHHSNGQDGEEFYAPGVFNKYNGNFSTDYVEPSLYYRNRYGGDKPTNPLYPDARTPYFDWFTKLSYQAYFSTDDVLEPSYGKGKINIQTGLIRVKNANDFHTNTGVPFNRPYNIERYRVLFSMAYITGERDLGLGTFEKRFNTEASFHYRISESPNTALMFMVGYYGSDPYNIYYADNYFYMRIGISTGLFVAPRREKI